MATTHGLGSQRSGWHAPLGRMVPHFDAKGEANELFIRLDVPTTFLQTDFTGKTVRIAGERLTAAGRTRQL